MAPHWTDPTADARLTDRGGEPKPGGGQVVVTGDTAPVGIDPPQPVLAARVVAARRLAVQEYGLAQILVDPFAILVVHGPFDLLGRSAKSRHVLPIGRPRPGGRGNTQQQAGHGIRSQPW